MKKAFISSILFLALAVTPAAAHAQLVSLFNLKATNKATVTAPAVTADTTTTTTVQGDTSAADPAPTDDLSATDLQNQPLPVRRQIVAAQLGDILLKLNLLADKTKTAADRLTQNGINTDASQKDLVVAATTLAQAKVSIDALAVAANDPANQAVVDLAVNGIPFKDAVIKTETTLRTARQSLIDALTALKVAVSTSVTVTAQ